MVVNYINLVSTSV